MASSMLMSITCAPFSTCWRATASASSNWPARIMRANAFEPVTLVRSPMLTNSDAAPIATGSSPERRNGGTAVSAGEAREAAASFMARAVRAPAAAAAHPQPRKGHG